MNQNLKNKTLKSNMKYHQTLKSTSHQVFNDCIYNEDFISGQD